MLAAAPGGRPSATAGGFPPGQPLRTQLIRPCPQPPPDGDQLSQMVRVVVRQQECLAEHCLSAAVRQPGQKVDLRIGHQPAHRLQVGGSGPPTRPRPGRPAARRSAASSRRATSAKRGPAAGRTPRCPIGRCAMCSSRRHGVCGIEEPAHPVSRLADLRPPDRTPRGLRRRPANRERAPAVDGPTCQGGVQGVLVGAGGF